MLVFGVIMVAGALLLLVYYFYRQATGANYDVVFPNNYVALHPELNRDNSPEVAENN